jgi:2-keto-3-deoxy-L-rhamnonate aldolase RhmA
MAIAENLTKARLRAGGLVQGLGLRQARTVDIGLIARSCGFDWLFIDCEHNAMDLATACEIATAALGQGVTPLVRVAGKEAHHTSRALDNGAQGVVVPHVDTAEEAEAVVRIGRYPPRGARSIARASPLYAFESVPIDRFLREVDAETLLVVMLESPKAIDNVDAIAAVDGIDVLLIGTNDFCVEAGIPGSFDHPTVDDAYARMIAACKRHGKVAGMAGVRDEPQMARYVEQGVRFVLSGTDLGLLMDAARARTRFIRDLVKG